MKTKEQLKDEAYDETNKALRKAQEPIWKNYQKRLKEIEGMKA
jgi:hypothetical protein